MRREQEQVALFLKREKAVEKLRKKPLACPRCRMRDEVSFVQSHANFGNVIQRPFRPASQCSYRCERCGLRFSRPIFDEVKEEKDVDLLNGVPVELK